MANELTVERVLDVLGANAGNTTKAAAELGISRGSLYYFRKKNDLVGRESGIQPAEPTDFPPEELDERAARLLQNAERRNARLAYNLKLEKKKLKQAETEIEIQTMCTQAVSDLMYKERYVTKKPASQSGQPHFMELSLYDLHFAKYCWAAMTGQDYDTGIAAKVMADATTDLLSKVSNYNVDHIIIPIGHDFYHADNWLSQTTSGTQVESCDTRFSRAFEIGVDAMMGVIEACLGVASTVEGIYVPGNHDTATSFYLCKVIQAAHRANNRVTVDTETHEGHRNRKYRLRGKTLLGYIHGAHKDSPRESNLPLLMAQEVPDLWGKSLERAWRLGHLHTKRTTAIPLLDIFNGVRIERIPSLTATDEWHFANGYAGNRRAAEAWLWSYENGYEAQFTAYA